MKKILAILLAVCMLLSLCGCAKAGKSGDNGATIEGNGFKSAEKAALAYAEALRTGDVRKILSTFAMETYVDSMNIEEYLRASGVYYFDTNTMGLVSSDDYSKEIRLIGRQYDIARQLGYLYMNHTEFGIPEGWQPVPWSKIEPYDEFAEAMTVEDWYEILADMEIGDVLTLGEILPDRDKEQMAEALKRSAERYGCDKMVPLAVEVTIDGVDYYLCVDVADYDGIWYNCQMFGTIASMLGADSTSCGLVER